MNKKISLTYLWVSIFSATTFTHCVGSGTDISSSTLATPIPSPTSSNNGTLDSEEQEFVVLINDYRQANGVPALEVAPILIPSSKWMSTDMAMNNYFSHTDSLGRDPFTRMADFGYLSYTSAGENIAAGSETASDTFTQWQNSPAHNANMLDASYLFFGVGRAYSLTSTYGWYWTTDFGSDLN